MTNTFVLFVDNQLFALGYIVHDVTYLLLFIVLQEKLIVKRYCIVSKNGLPLYQLKKNGKKLFKYF